MNNYMVIRVYFFTYNDHEYGMNHSWIVFNHEKHKTARIANVVFVPNFRELSKTHWPDPKTTMSSRMGGVRVQRTRQPLETLETSDA